jgi:hypothetical protein
MSKYGFEGNKSQPARKALFVNSSGRDDEKQREISTKLACMPGEIRTDTPEYRLPLHHPAPWN